MSGITENTPLLQSAPQTTSTLPPTPEVLYSNQDRTTKFHDQYKDARTNYEDFSEQNKRPISQTNGQEAITINPDPTTTDEKPGFLSQFKGRTRFVLIICSLANFLACCAFSLLAPFYPLVAEKKGMSLTLIGFVFSAFQLVIFLTSPIIGNYLTKIGPKFVYLSGIFVGGTCVILFGLLDKCPNGTPFVVMSILCRSVEALGCAAFITASFAIISNECRNAIGTAYAVLETSAGLGFMVGPAVGGALFQVGGYGLPFYVMGVLILLNGVLIYRYLPAPEKIEKKRRGSMFRLLRSPMLLVSLLNILVGQIGITMFDSTFATHMDKFGLSTVVIGLFFVIPPGLYAIVAPLWGYLTDHKDYSKTLLIMGSFLYACGYFFMGPSPLFPFLPNTLGIIALGLLLVGFSFGMLIIPAMKLMVTGAYELKYEANMDTYALVSGLFNSVNSFGGFLGPMVGGIVVQKYGHPVLYSSESFACLFVMVLGSVYFLIRYHRHKDEKEMTTTGDDNDTTSLLPGRRSSVRVDDINVIKARRGRRRSSSMRVHLALSRSMSIPEDVQ